MRRQPRARLQHGKHRADEARHALHQPPRLRALVDIAFVAADNSWRERRWSSRGPRRRSATIVRRGRSARRGASSACASSPRMIVQLLSSSATQGRCGCRRSTDCREPHCWRFRRSAHCTAFMNRRASLLRRDVSGGRSFDGLFSFANGCAGIVTSDGARTELFCAMMSSPTYARSELIRRLDRLRKATGFPALFCTDGEDVARVTISARVPQLSSLVGLLSTERKFCGTIALHFTQFDCCSAPQTHLRLIDFAAAGRQIDPQAVIADRPAFARAHRVHAIEIGKLQRAPHQRRNEVCVDQ